MKNTYRIAEISYGSPEWDCTYSFEIENTIFECKKISTHRSVEYTKTLIDQLSHQFDAIALTGLPYSTLIKQKHYAHPNYLEIMNHPCSVSLNDGHEIKSLLNFESILNLIQESKINKNQSILFPQSIKDLDLVEFLRNSEQFNITIGDFLEKYSIIFNWSTEEKFINLQKKMLTLSQALGAESHKLFSDLKLNLGAEMLFSTQQKKYDVIFGDAEELLDLDLKLNFLSQKTIITPFCSSEIYSRLTDRGVKTIHILMPERFNCSAQINYPVLETALRLIHEKDSRLQFADWETILSTPEETKQKFREYRLSTKDSFQIKSAQIIKKVVQQFNPQKNYDFAFVVHALSHEAFQLVPGLGSLLKLIPEKFDDSIDELISKSPGVYFGTIENIQSEHTGKTVRGVLYALLMTPKVMKNSNPELIYKKIESLCQRASDNGAQIMGLGAYTKVVGDSGLTISKNSPIPVTTGNSLSAAATLWALRVVIDKMNLIQKDPVNQKYNATVMVIGATGSIGKVSAKLLAYKCKKLILVAPNLEKLESLKNEILMTNSDCEIIVSTSANDHAEIADALVTATTAIDTVIVDIMKLKPGCVICDCSRPLDFKSEQAQKRPDVLIIESGEVHLPGPVKMNCDIGLPDNSVYACLAETAILALEGKFESFTLGREISVEKVIEIYRLSIKHGVKLAKIQGHLGEITDKEITIVRNLALKKLKLKI